MKRTQFPNRRNSGADPPPATAAADRETRTPATHHDEGWDRTPSDAGGSGGRHLPELDRRDLLKGLGAGGLSTGLAGCSGPGADTVEAAAYGLVARTALGLGFSDLLADDPSFEADTPLGGTVTVINKLVLYLASGGDRAPLGVLSAADASAFGQSLNPLATFSLRRLLVEATELAILQGMLASMDLIADDFAGWEREPEPVDERTASTFDTETAVTVFVARTRDAVVLLALTRVALDDEAVVVVSGRSKALDDLDGGEPMDAFSGAEVEALTAGFTDALPELEGIDPERVKGEMEGEGETDGDARTGDEAGGEERAEVASAVLDGFEGAGTSLERMADDLAERIESTDPAQRRDAATGVLARGLEDAASPLRGSADRLVASLDRRDGNEGPLAAHRRLPEALATSSRAVSEGSVGEAAAELRTFASILHDMVARERVEVEQPALDRDLDRLERTSGEILELTELLATVANRGNDSAAVRFLRDAVRLGQSSPDDLSESAQSLLAIEDEFVRELVGLDEPDAVETLERIGSIVESPEFADWLRVVERDPLEYATSQLLVALVLALSDLGAVLTSIGTVTPIRAYVVGEWLQVCGCESPSSPAPINCKAVETELTATDDTDPDEVDNMIKWLNRILIGLQALGKKPIGSGAALKGAKHVGKIRKMKRPFLWVKIQWQACEETWCTYTFDGDECAWVTHTKWVVVPWKTGPTGNKFWPGTRQWDKSIIKRAKEKVSEAVDREGPCP